MALENSLGSAPPVFGSNLLFTSAIRSQPLKAKVLHQINRALLLLINLKNIKTKKIALTLGLDVLPEDN